MEQIESIDLTKPKLKPSEKKILNVIMKRRKNNSRFTTNGRSGRSKIVGLLTTLF